MSIFEKLFGGTPASSAPPTGVANPGQPLPGTQASPQTAPNGLVPTAPTPAAPAPEVSPLDGFKDIWQTPANPAANSHVKYPMCLFLPTNVCES